MTAKITAVTNQKGGVGKTTTCINLGKNVADRGNKVLLLDNDSQGDLSKNVLEDWRTCPAQTVALYNENDEAPKPVEIGENLHLIASNKLLETVEKGSLDCIFTFAERVEALADDYDYVFIDCPPGLGTRVSAAFAAADNVLVPFKVSKLSTTNIDELLGLLKNIKKRVNPKVKLTGFINNLRPQQYTKLEADVMQQMNENFPDLIFEKGVSTAIRIEESHYALKSIHEYQPGSKQDLEYQDITNEFLRRVNHVS